MSDSDETIKAIEAEYARLKQYPDMSDAPYTYLKRIQVLNKNGGLAFEAPAHIFIQRDEADWIRANFKRLAEHGVIAAVAKDLYSSMKGRSLQQARAQVKDFTRHNDKLGFDYSVPKRAYVANLNKQFASSSYDKFLEKAANLHSGNAEYAAHLRKAAQQFTIKDAEREEILAKTGGTAEIPEKSTFERRIAGLEMELDNTNRVIEEKDFELNELTRVIRGYDDKVVIDPASLSVFPKKLKQNVKYVFDQMTSGPESHYVKSLVEPFHPDSVGARVPELMPRETITYSDYESLSHVGSFSDKFIAFSNLEFQFSHPFYIVRNQTASKIVDQLLTGNPTVENVSRDSVTYNLSTIPIGTGAEVGQAIIRASSANLNDYFMKSRTVSAGMRVVKTSTSDTESGTLDIIYSRDGAGLDAGSTLSNDLGRARQDRIRLYLASQEACCVRGTSGFVAQCNFRPYSDNCFSFLDTEANNFSSDRHTMAFAGQTSDMWFVQNGGIKKFDELQFDATETKFVMQSFTQRHTVIMIGQDLSANMTLSIQHQRQIEGIPDLEHQGFLQAATAELHGATSPLELLTKYNADGIFYDYSRRRESLMRAILEDRILVTGYWKDTLFPMAKDIIRYGADYLTSSKGDSMVDAAVDAAASTLSALFPEAMGAILALDPHAKAAAQKGTHYLADKVKEWTLRGNHFDLEAFQGSPVNRFDTKRNNTLQITYGQ